MRSTIFRLAATGLFILLIAQSATAVPQRIISASFFEPLTFPQSGPMLDTAIAGVPSFQVALPAVMRVPNWNQLRGNSGVELDLHDSQAFMTDVDAQWIATSFNSNTYTNELINGDSMMMNGHLFSSTLGITGLATVTVSGLDLAFEIASGYEVWVYADPEGIGQSESLFVDDGTMVGAALTMTDTVPGGARQFDFTQDYDEGTTDGLGVWARFGGLTGSSFTIEARSLVPGGSAYITGFQIVGHPIVPEPSAIVMLLLAALAMAGHRSRK